MQAKLLRAVQEKRVRPVGSNDEVSTDVRLLSATHKTLSREVDEGRFREDLFFRINVIELAVPSLRERREDIPLLADSLLLRITSAHQERTPAISTEAMQVMSRYRFPGNVRELENMLERAFALCENDTIEADDLQIGSIDTIPGKTKASEPTDLLNKVAGDLDAYLAELERQVLCEALDEYRWNRTETAKALGVSFRSLRYRMKKLALDD
jgi:two-component system response regulator PilR (NtrC family)